MKKMLGLVGLICVLFTGCDNSNRDIVLNSKYEEEMQEAISTPFAKYPEEITYTLGKMTGTNNSNMPLGDTYENNVYTRYLKEMLNIQNKNIFETNENEYSTSISMAITSGELPDVMVITSLSDLELLVENDMIEDLTESYENCASDRIKDIYSSYGDEIIDRVTFDGKIMAIPGTNISNGPNLIWLRKDWIDKLGLEEPKTLKDVEYIIEQFVEKNPNNNKNGTVGLVCDVNLCGENGYSAEYLLDIIFANFGAFPKQWIKKENGEIVYGSVQPEVKSALKYLRKLYKKNILDKDFLFRTSINIIELLENGECGSFFGPWWAANNPLAEVMRKDTDAEWKPYLISTDEDGSTSYYSEDISYQYVVVRKGFEYPELVCKMISVLFDYIRYEDIDEEDNKNFKNYYMINVDPTARPIPINVDYIDALNSCYQEINKALEDESYINNLELLESAYYDSCKSYLSKSKKERTVEEWSAYNSRIIACSVLSKGKINKLTSSFFGETETMKSEWWKLKDLEKKTYLKIICCEEDIDYFDSFVKEWNNAGGQKIIQEVNQNK